MSVAYVWHSFSLDSEALLISVRSWHDNFSKSDDAFVVREEINRPISQRVREELAACYGVRFIQRPSMKNLCGPGAPEAVLQGLAEAGVGHDFVWKIDSDAVCFGNRHRRVLELARPILLGAPYVWFGRMVARGFAYCLRADAAAAAAAKVEEFAGLHGPPNFDEDAIVSACVMAHCPGRVCFLPYDPDNGYWAGWNYETNREPARYHSTFDLVSFGNPPKIRAQRDATMRRVYADFLAARVRLDTAR